MSSNQNLRTAIGQHVVRVIASTQDVSDQEKHNWIEISTDYIVKEFLRFLPEAIDVKSKYEIGEDGRIEMPSAEDATDSEIQEHILLLMRYADDNGYNRYRHDIISSINALYNMTESGVEYKNE